MRVLGIICLTALMILSSFSMAQNAVSWKSKIGVSDAGSGTIVSSCGSSTWLEAQSRSQDYLDTNENGSFEFVVDASVVTKMIGFIREGDSFPITGNSQMDYGFYQYHSGSQKLSAWESGTNTAISDYSVDDTLRLERINDTVIYYRNDTVLRKVTVSINEKWYIQTNFYNSLLGKKFKTVKSDFTKKDVHIAFEVTDIVAPASTGIIDITASGGSGPYTYLWNNDSTTQDLDSLSTAKYTVTVTDSLGESSTDSVWVFEKTKPEWVELYGAELISESKLRSTGGTLSWTKSQGRASNYLEPDQDGEFHYTIKDNVCVKILGFIEDGDDFPIERNDIDFGLYQYYFYPELFSIESGSIQLVNPSLSIGDVLKLQRIGNEIRYYVNDELVKTTSISTPTKRWYLHATFYNKWINEYYEDVEVSFATKRINLTYSTNDIRSQGEKGSINLTIGGGDGPYSVSWSNGSTLEDLSDLEVGDYTVSVSDTVGDTIQITIPIYQKEYVSWSDPLNTIASGANDKKLTNISNLSDFDVTQGRSVQYLDIDEDGEITFTCSQSTIKRKFGFVQDDDPYPGATQQWQGAIYIYQFQQYYGETGQNWVVFDYNNAVNGDVYKISRVNNVLSYYKNGILQRQTTVSPTGKWYVQAALKENNSYIEDVEISFIKSKRLALDESKSGTEGDNWVYNEVYDLDGNLSGQNMQYFDQMGRPDQAQVVNLAENLTLVTQSIPDYYGRAGIQTLPAPGASSIGYITDFVKDSTGAAYNYLSYDKKGKVYTPNPVNDSVVGTLGHYYSDNGIEDYVATSGYPYIRRTFSADPIGSVQSTSSAGDEMHLGNGREQKSFSMYSANELDAIFGNSKSYKVIIDSTDHLESSALSISGDIIALKTIAVDADSNEVISYSANGRVIATARSGQATCTQSSVTKQLDYYGTQTVDLHLPAAAVTSIVLPLPVWFSGGLPTVFPSSKVDYYIVDLDSSRQLVGATDYTIGVSDRKVTFLGGYSSGSHFYRIRAEYDSAYVETILAAGSIVPKASINYKLDYSDWQINYYDLAGNLRKRTQPLGLDCSLSDSVSMASTFDYNQFGQNIASQSPDQGKVEITYNSDYQVKFSQNALQADSGWFNFVNYDSWGRTIESGVSQEASSGIYFDNFHGTSPSCGSCTSSNLKLDTNTAPFGNTNMERGYTVYDKLGASDSIPSAYSYRAQYNSNRLFGKLVKTYNNENESWYGYDLYGRSTYMIQQIKEADYIAEKTATNDQVKTIEMTYEASGRLKDKTFQKNVSTEEITHRLTYDANGRLNNVVATANGAIVGKANYKYYLTGQLKRKEIGNQFQGTDYVYTINGQLKSINHATLDKSNDPGQDGHSTGLHQNYISDLFAMSLDYYENDYVRDGSEIVSSATEGTNGNYNGLVKATRWRNAISNKIHRGSGGDVTLYASITDTVLMYDYQYDYRGQLSRATFGTFDNGTEAFTSRDDYLLEGTAGNGISYDKNGNISNLARNAYSGNEGINLDSLVYTYSANTNQLASIVDHASNSYTDDFETTGSETFTYNKLGQLTNSQPEDVRNIQYFGNGLTQTMVFNSTGNRTDYTYNERGQKLKSEYFDSTSAVSKFTWYITDASGAIQAWYDQDEAGADTIALVARPVYAGDRLGTYYQGDTAATYELKDHLGNVRVAARESNNADGYIAVSWTDFYPFGAAMPGRQSGSYKFGLEGKEQTEGNSWVNYELRMYNASLGRFTTTDPFGQFHSPYLANFNNPVSFSDPSGGWSRPTWFQQQDMLNSRQSYLADWQLQSWQEREKHSRDMSHPATYAKYEIDGLLVSGNAGRSYMRQNLNNIRNRGISADNIAGISGDQDLAAKYWNQAQYRGKQFDDEQSEKENSNSDDKGNPNAVILEEVSVVRTYNGWTDIKAPWLNIADLMKIGQNAHALRIDHYSNFMYGSPLLGAMGNAKGPEAAERGIFFPSAHSHQFSLSPGSLEGNILIGAGMSGEVVMMMNGPQTGETHFMTSRWGEAGIPNIPEGGVGTTTYYWLGDSDYFNIGSLHGNFTSVMIGGGWVGPLWPDMEFGSSSSPYTDANGVEHSGTVLFHSGEYGSGHPFGGSFRQGSSEPYNW